MFKFRAATGSHFIRRPLGLWFLALTLPATAQGELLEGIDISTTAETVQVTLRFTAPMAYIRHHPPAKGEVLQVTLEALGSVNIDGLRREQSRRLPPDKALPAFSVSVHPDPGCASPPRAVCLMIQFDQPVAYRLRMGPDRRHLILALPRADGNAVSPSTDRKPAP